MPALFSSVKQHNLLPKQKGAALMVMLVILIVGVTAMLLSSLNSAAPRLLRVNTSTETLKQAKEALIGYAVTYADTNPNVNGFLPCPDQGQNGTQDGEAKSNCGSKNVSVIGKFPWKTLGVTTLKDGNGDCFWYAVSGTYKNNPDTDLMNWDNYGLFQIMASDGINFLAGSTTDSQPIAVIFSVGTPLGAQARTPGTNTPSCGGNYTATNYLDNDTVHGINNAAVSASPNAVTKFIAGSIKDGTDKEIVNDRLLVITKDDLFNIIKKRSDFATFINTSVIVQAVSCLSSLPNPKTIDFSTMNESPGTTLGMGMNQIITGRIPNSSCTGAPNNAVKKWRDNLAYAKCSMGTCLTINSLPCKGAIIFTGEKNSTQYRISNSQKNDWSNYLEGVALNIFTSGAAPVSGVATAYNPAATSTDIWGCIP